MGLFKKKKEPKQNEARPIIKWLTYAEQQLDTSYKTRNYSPMKELMVPTALAELSRQLQNYEFYEGIIKHRNTSWNIIQEKQDGSYVVDRVVTYNNMKIGPGLYIPVGDNFAQTWYISVVNGKWSISSIVERSLIGWTA